MSVGVTFQAVGTDVTQFEKCEAALPGLSKFFAHSSELVADVLPPESHSSGLWIFTLLKCK